MPLSWNEIRHNAIQFSRRWAGANSEIAEKQTFWNEFFQLFGIPRRTVATFEERVANLAGNYDHIDLFWPGMLLVEHKSLGKDLGEAGTQAYRYIGSLVNAGREEEVPRYVIVSDFARISLVDLEPEDAAKKSALGGCRIEFPLAELHRHIHEFAFIPGYKQHRFEEQDPINLRAVRIMDDLHDALEDGGYSGHELERFLVRVLFCLFAEDTGIFEREAFHLYLENRTEADGSDLGLHLARLFEVLNTPVESRQKNLDETLAAFPYVNGELFAEKLGFADFNRDMRNSLLACTRFDWSCISPAVFGSLFQGIMEPRERRQIGGHYTSERDILKVIRALFLDDLRAEFDRIMGNKNQLRQFQQKIAGLRFLDPACGCGNFLVIAYRELRLLEIEVLLALYGREQQHLDIAGLSLIDVDAFYGIEISEWPARIAEVAMWLMDHQMNVRLSEVFGQYFVRLPLKKSPTIVCGNALRLDWKEILPPEKCSYVLGNPPFVGKQFATKEQKADMALICGNVRSGGVLDYVAGWYFKAAEYIGGTKIIVGFVSTNSISQGEQVGILWKELFTRYHPKIHFAHRTFAWESEAKGKAHVHVVVIGFAGFDTGNKRIYDYENGGEKVAVSTARNISPYLVEGSDIVVQARTAPICDVPALVFGSKATDGGNLILDQSSRDNLVNRFPQARQFVRPYISAEEFIHRIPRYCLWLVDADPKELRSIPGILERVERVRHFRLASSKKQTQEKALEPSVFAELRQPSRRFLAIPKTSSERRRYIPIAFLTPKTIVASEIYFCEGARLFHFGVLSSRMHMAWVRQVCGRLESRYRYSNKLVYNNYPWPESLTEKQRATVEMAAQAVLDTREEHLKKDATFADLYDTLTMPPALVKAHATLDRAVDRCYRKQPFTSERQRVEFLFALYEKLTTPLIAAAGRSGANRPGAARRSAGRGSG